MFESSEREISKLSNAHTFQSFPFRDMLSGANPISSNCIAVTAHAPQWGHVTKRHKQAPPITKENDALLPNHSLVLNHVTNKAILLDASWRILAISLSISGKSVITICGSRHWRQWRSIGSNGDGRYGARANGAPHCHWHQW